MREVVLWLRVGVQSGAGAASRCHQEVAVIAEIVMRHPGVVDVAVVLEVALTHYTVEAEEVVEGIMAVELEDHHQDFRIVVIEMKTIIIMRNIMDASTGTAR